MRDLGPFRAIDAKALSNLSLVDRAFGWTAEMQAKALRFGIPTMQVNVSWKPGLGESEISGTWRGVARAARDLIGHSLREILIYRLSQVRRRMRPHQSLDPASDATHAGSPRQ